MTRMLIDPPSPFATLADWQAFEREISEPAKADPDAARYHREALAMIAELKAEDPEMAALRAEQGQMRKAS